MATLSVISSVGAFGPNVVAPPRLPQGSQLFEIQVPKLLSGLDHPLKLEAKCIY